MDRQNYADGLLVQSPHLTTLQDNVELALAREAASTSAADGPETGLVPTPDGVSLTLSVSAGTGIATDANGNKRRVRLAAGDTISLAASVPSTNPRYAAVCLQFDRTDSNPYLDAGGATVYEDNTETATLVLVNGSENVSPSKPAIPDDHVLIADFYLSPGDTALTDAMMDRRRARPSWGKVGSPCGVPSQLADFAALGPDNCRVVPEEPAIDQSVVVRAGRITFDGESFTIAQTTIGPAAAATAGESYYRAIVIDATGTATYLDGDETSGGGTPTAPDWTGYLALALVRVYDSTVRPATLAGDITDVRPFLRGTGTGLNRYDRTGSTSATVNLPFSYTTGNDSIAVYHDGVLLQGGGVDYTETDSTTVTLTSAPLVGDNITVIGAKPAAAVASSVVPLSGLIVGGFEAYSEGDLTVTIKPFSIVGADGIVYHNTVDYSIDGLLLALSSSTWYYVYAFINSGAVDFEVSTTAPDTRRRFKSGDSTRLYLFPLRSTSSSKVRAFHRVGRTTTWVYDVTVVGAGDPLYAAGAVLASTAVKTAVSLASAFPPHIRRGWVALDGSGVDGDSVTVFGRGGQVQKWGHAFLTDGNQQIVHPVQMDSSQQIDLQMSAGTFSTSVLGLEFDE